MQLRARSAARDKVTRWNAKVGGEDDDSGSGSSYSDSDGLGFHAEGDYAGSDPTGGGGDAEDRSYVKHVQSNLGCVSCACPIMSCPIWDACVIHVT